MRHGGAAHACGPWREPLAEDGVVDDAREAVVKVDGPGGLGGRVREREGGEGVAVEGGPGCAEEGEGRGWRGHFLAGGGCGMGGERR